MQKDLIAPMLFTGGLNATGFEGWLEFFLITTGSNSPPLGANIPKGGSAFRRKNFFLLYKLALKPLQKKCRNIDGWGCN